MQHLDLAARSRCARFLACGALLLLLLSTAGASEPRSRAFVAEHKDLVGALRGYLDPQRDHATTWAEMEAVVGPMTAAGDRVLTDPDRLRWLTDQARSFEPPFSDRTWRKLHGVHTSVRHGRMRRIVSEDLRLTWMEPRGYDAKNRWRRYPRRDPSPWLITLHERVDGRGREPAGVAWLKRRWPYAKARSLHENWLVLAPEAPAAEFVAPDGTPHLNRTIGPLQAFWQRYHVDFDRVLLEGGTQAVDLAAMVPYWLAGIVLRGARLAPRHEKLIRNFAFVPVFVVDDKRLAGRLRAAGHRGVTVGTDDEVLAWMEARRRTLPASYSWDATRLEHSRSPWVMVEARNPASLRSTLKVESVDTKKDPNTLRIETTGIHSVSVFLDDRIADLDRPVRIVINGTLAHTARPAHARFARDFKGIWASTPLHPRKTRRYMDLFPAQAARIDVPGSR